MGNVGSSKKVASWLVLLVGLVLVGCDSRSPNAGQPQTADSDKSRAAPRPQTTKPLPSRATALDQLISYAVIERAETRNIKVSYDLRVDLVDGRLPSEAELAAISRHLHAKERTHERTFVLFYLPGMPPGAGAFATAHHNPSLKVKVLDYMLPEQYRHLLATNQVPKVGSRSGGSTEDAFRGQVQLELSVRMLSDVEIELTVSTNIPLPIDVMASVNLMGQKPDDVWIGLQERIRLTTSPQIVVLDASKSRKLLQAGEYEAKVFFNHRYAKNPKAASIKGNHEARAAVGRLGVAESAAQSDARNKLQQWVRQMYSLLMEIKSTQDFAYYGFGRGGPYHGWMEAVEAARRLDLPFEDGVALGYLLTLGMEYLEPGENEVTRFARAELDRYLKGASEWHDVDPETLRELSRFLELWGEYPQGTLP